MSNRSKYTENHQRNQRRGELTLNAKRLRLAQNQGPSGHTIVRRANRRLRQS